MQHGRFFAWPQGRWVCIDEVGGGRERNDVIVYVAPDHIGHALVAGGGGNGQETLVIQRIRFCEIRSLQSLNQLIFGHVFHGLSIPRNLLNGTLRGGAPPVHIKEDQFPQPLDSMVPADNARKHARPAGEGPCVEQAVGPVGVGTIVFLLVAAVRIHVHQHAAEIVGAFRVLPAQEHHPAVRQHGGEPVIVLVKGKPAGRFLFPVVKVEVAHVIHPGHAGHPLHAGSIDENNPAVRQVAGIIAVRIRRHMRGKGFLFPGFQIQLKNVPGPAFLLAESVPGEHELLPGKINIQMPDPAVVRQQLLHRGRRGNPVKFHNAAAVSAPGPRHAGNTLPVRRTVMIERTFPGRIETPHAHPFLQAVLFRQGFNQGFSPQIHHLPQQGRLSRPGLLHPPVQRPQLLLPLIQPCQETFRTGVPFPVLVPVSLHRAADGRRVIIGRQLLQPEETDSFLNGFLMLNQVIPGRNSSNTLRGNGKNFRQRGTGCLPVRPRLKYGNQQNHRIPAIVSGSRLGKGSRIFRRPRPYLPHPCILFFRGRLRRDYGQLPQPGLQTGSVEHSGTQQDAGT